jgi:hypothetical protein
MLALNEAARTDEQNSRQRTPLGLRFMYTASIDAGDIQRCALAEAMQADGAQKGAEV